MRYNKMIAYNNEWLYNRHIQAQADEALASQYIDPATHKTIFEKYAVHFYTPNFFVRIGLALLTMVVVFFVTGLLGLMFREALGSFSYFLIFIGVACYAGAEYIMRSNMHYNSGVDNMLTWLAAFATCSGIAWALGYSPHIEIAQAFAVTVICLLLALRFADTFLSIAAAIALLCMVFFCFQNSGAMSYTIMPFVLIVISVALYFVAVKAMAVQGSLLYKQCLTAISIVALIGVYAAGNYYVVNELSGRRYSYGITFRPSLSFGWFFWLWTFAMPAVYIWLGIRSKNIIIIRVGLPLIAASLFTFRYYHHVLSPELAMLLGGTILFIASYMLIKYLRIPHGGFTFEPERTVSNDPDLVKILTGEVISNSGHAHHT